MRERLQLWFLAAMAGLALMPADSSLLAADAIAPLTMQAASVGVGGKCKAGYWAPIRLNLVAGRSGLRGNLEIVIADGDNVPVIYADEADGTLDLEANEAATIVRYAKIGPQSAPIRVQLRAANEVVWSQALNNLPARLAATEELVVGMGPDLDLASAVATFRRSQEMAITSVQVESPADLPDRWWGYDGVDTVVLATSDAQWLAGLSSEQREALMQWIRLGGRLVFSLGSRGEQFAAGGGPWAGLVPGKFVEVAPLRERAGLETFAGAELPWDSEDFQQNRPQVTRLAQIDGTVLVDEDGGGADRPLVSRSAYGLGEVVFVGLDLDHPGLAKWSGRPRLIASLLAGSHRRAEEQPGEGRRGITHLGYNDLVGQLRAALDQFAGVTLVNFTTVAVLTIVYLLLIGPGDFLLLTWLKIPRQVTWITFTLIAVSFALIAWYFKNTAHGDRVRLNQVEIVDLDAQSGVVRGTVWTHLYTPATARFSVEPTLSTDLFEAKPVGRLMAWQGLPGDSLGGLSSRQVALTQIDPYRVLPPGQRAGVAELPIQSASSKSLSTRWWGETTGPISSSLRRNEFGALEGELSNPLGVELTDCLVAYEDRLYRLGKLQPGQKISMGELSPLHLEARLTERTIAGSKDLTTPWVQSSTDVPRIVQMMMFHEAARGRSYTGLAHRYQPYIDLSGHLRLSRAVLAGRTAQGVTQFTAGERPLAAADDTATLTWCRVIFPVQPQPTAASPP